MEKRLVICCSEITDPRWRWIASYFANVNFEFIGCVPRTVRGLSAVLNAGRFFGCLEAVRLARRKQASVLVTHGPTLAAWCALFARLLGVKVAILAHSFNFVTLPGPLKTAVFRFALQRVNRFVVFSRIEREIYSKAFHRPIEQFDFVHWGVQPPKVDSREEPIEAGDYVVAIGGNARDYRTLLEAARAMPDLRFALVVRPESLKGLVVPSNASVHCNIAFSESMNLLQYSRFMVLPLVSAEVPCGHVTLVAAMHLGKAMVVTNSCGVHDYAAESENALLVDVGSPEALIRGIRRLWEDRELCRRLGETGRLVAGKECVESRIAEHFGSFLSSLSA
jgi:glycosyltransferase involved in cell wall biosynthesis